MLEKEDAHTSRHKGEVLTAKKAHLETKSRTDSILQQDPGIRYVAITDYSNTTIECKGQGTFQLPLETFRSFVSIGPLLALSAMACKIESSCGRLGYLVGRFEKALVAIYQLHYLMVVVAVDSTYPLQRLEEFASFLKRMEKREWKV